MKKIRVIVVMVFLSFIAFVSVGSLLTKDREFSPNENRYLEEKPKISVDNIMNGSFQEDLENYLRDQVIGRDAWITVKTGVEKACGNTDIGGAYVGKDGYDFEKITPEDVDDTLFRRNAETVSEEGILENFIEGRTLCAIIDTDSLYRLEGCSYSLTKMPDLNEKLKTSVCAMTEMLVVNEFSEKQKQAADFAKFATVSMAEELHETSGHYSVFKNTDADMVEKTAYETYEEAVLAPNSQDAKDFWVGLKETIAKYF